MNAKLEQIYDILAHDEQDSDRKLYYVMRMRFLLTISFHPNDLIPNTMGSDETIVMPQTAIYRTTQITDFIPDAGMIAKYVDALKKTFNENPERKAHLVRLSFDGYDYVYAVNRKEEAPGVPTKDALRQLVWLAYDSGTIVLIPDPNGDELHEPVMMIGDDWLYFDSDDGDIGGLTPSQYVQKHDRDYVVDHMTDAVWDLYQMDPQSAEPAYIFCVLYENVERAKTSYGER